MQLLPRLIDPETYPCRELDAQIVLHVDVRARLGHVSDPIRPIVVQPALVVRDGVRAPHYLQGSPGPDIEPSHREGDKTYRVRLWMRDLVELERCVGASQRVFGTMGRCLPQGILVIVGCKRVPAIDRVPV